MSSTNNLSLLCRKLVSEVTLAFVQSAEIKVLHINVTWYKRLQSTIGFLLIISINNGCFG